MDSIRRPHVIDIAALVVLIAATVFRVAFVPDARLAGDEASLYATARHIAEFKMFPVKGVNMTGDAAMTPGGLYHLIMAVPYFFSDNPMAGGVYVVILNILGLALGYCIFKREFGRAAALGVLILSAFNPFSVFFSDRQWNPNLLVPLGYLWLWLMLGAFRGEGRFRWGWLAALLVVSPQIHMSCPQLTLMTLVMLAVWRPKVRWGHVATGIGIGIATYVPYFVVDAMDGWANTIRIISKLAEAATPWYEAFRAGYYQILYAGGDYTYFLGKGFWFPMTEWGFLAGGGTGKYAALAGLPGLGGWVAIGLVALAIAAALIAHGYALWRSVAGWFGGFTAFVRREPLVILAVLNIPVLILLMLKTNKAFYPHYSMVLFPLAMVPTALLISRVRSRRIAAILVAAASILAVNQAVLTSRYYRTEESKASVYLMTEATRTVLQDAGVSSFRMVVDMPGTRMGSYPMSVVAREYFDTPWRETKDSRLMYVLAPAGSRHERDAIRIWDIDGRRLIRKMSGR